MDAAHQRVRRRGEGRALLGLPRHGVAPVPRRAARGRAAGRDGPYRRAAHRVRQPAKPSRGPREPSADARTRSTPPPSRQPARLCSPSRPAGQHEVGEIVTASDHDRSHVPHLRREPRRRRPARRFPPALRDPRPGGRLPRRELARPAAGGDVGPDRRRRARGVGRPAHPLVERGLDGPAVRGRRPARRCAARGRAGRDGRVRQRHRQPLQAAARRARPAPRPVDGRRAPRRVPHRPLRRVRGRASARRRGQWLGPMDPAAPVPDRARDRRPTSPAALHDDVAVVLLSVVDYRSAAIADVAAITRTAHDAGALVVWDCSHAAGSVPARSARARVPTSPSAARTSTSTAVPARPRGSGQRPRTTTR